MPYKFNTPVVEEGPIGPHRLWEFYKLSRGLAVLRFGDDFYETQVPSQEELDEADAYYLGGHEYIVSDEEAAVLTAAGYSEFLTEL